MQPTTADLIRQWLGDRQPQQSVAPSNQIGIASSPVEETIDQAIYPGPTSAQAIYARLVEGMDTTPTAPKVDWRAIAGLALDTQRAQREEAQRQAQAAAEAQQRTWTDTLVTMAARTGLPVAGGLVGALAGPVGAVAGVATAGALGEQLAQSYEVSRGQRTEQNPLEIFGQGAVAAVPGLPLRGGVSLMRQVPRVAASGAGMGALSTGVTQLAQEGELNPAGLAAGALGGATIGTGLGAGAVGLQSPAVRAIATRLATEERGSIPLGGPPSPRVMPQVPDAAPGGATSRTGTIEPAAPIEAPNVPAREAVVREPAAPDADFIARHERNMVRAGQEPEVAAESARELAEVLGQGPDATVTHAQMLREANEALPYWLGQKGLPIDEAGAGALAMHAAVRQQRLTTLINERGPNLRQRYLAGDPAAIGTVNALSEKYGVQGIDGIDRLTLEVGAAAAEATLADRKSASAIARALNFRGARKADGVADAEFLLKAQERGLPALEALEALAKLKDPAARTHALRQLLKPTAQDKWRAVMYSSWLSHLATHGVNIFGTSTSVLAREVMRSTLLAGVDRAISGATGRARQIASVSPLLLGKAYVEGIKAGYRSASVFLRTGFDTTPGQAGKHLDAQPLQAFDGLFGQAVSLPTKMLGAADAFMAQPPYWAEVYRRSMAKVLNELKSGEITKAEIKDRLDHHIKFHEFDDELVKKVQEYVRTALFKNEPGPGTRLISQGVKWLDSLTDIRKGPQQVLAVPLGTLMVPFRGTVAALARQGTKLSGGGLVTGYRELRYKPDPDTVKASQDIAEAIFGVSLIAALLTNMADGTIEVTGALPENAFERETMWARGSKPWGLKVGDRTIPASTLGPVAFPVAIAGAYLEAVKRDPKRPSDPFASIVAPALKSMLDGTMLKTTADFTNAIEEPRMADRFIGRTVTSFVPLAGAGRMVRDEVDPVLRNPGGAGATAKALGGGDEDKTSLGDRIVAGTRNITEEVAGSLPGLSQTVRPRVDLFGQEIQRSSSFERITGSPTIAQPLRDELVRLRQALPSWDDDAIYPSDPNRAIAYLETQGREESGSEDFRLTDDERTSYAKLLGQYQEKAIRQAIEHPSYAGRTDEQKAALIVNTKADAKKYSDKLWKRKHGADILGRIQRIREKRR